MSRERLQNLVPILLVALALAGFVLHRTGLLSPVQGVLVGLTTPFQKAASLVTTQFGGLAQTARDLRGLRQRNEDLEAENARRAIDEVLADHKHGV